MLTDPHDPPAVVPAQPETSIAKQLELLRLDVGIARHVLAAHPDGDAVAILDGILAEADQRAASLVSPGAEPPQEQK